MYSAIVYVHPSCGAQTNESDELVLLRCRLGERSKPLVHRGIKRPARRREREMRESESESFGMKLTLSHIPIPMDRVHM